MERIKLALERARQERTGTAAEASRPASGKPAASEHRVSYSHTRVFTPDHELMRRNRVIMGSFAEEYSAPYKILRTKVLQSMKANGWNALAITSPSDGAGKTLTAVNLAISLAQEVNQTVLLVDLDLLRPSVHRYFGYEPEVGLSDYLLHETPLPEMLFNPGVERLVVLPGRERIENSSETLSAPRMVQLVHELKTRYRSRLVLFDLPPVLSRDDAMAFSPYVDAALLVIESDNTEDGELLQAMEFLSSTQVIGTVLNKARQVGPRTYY